MDLTNLTMKNIKWHFEIYKPVYIIILAIVLVFGGVFWYEYEYPCLRGHYEEQWQTNWMVDANGNIYPMGGYYADVFVCDCRGVR